MKRKYKKKPQPSAQSSSSTGVPHNVLADDEVCLSFPYYFRDGHMWFPPTTREAGEYEGMEWAICASPPSLLAAAERKTSNEVIANHIAYCNECEKNGVEYYGNLMLIHPASADSKNKELRDVFRSVLDCPCYRGLEKEIQIGAYRITGVPNANFREFEDGWTAAVREYLKKQES